MMARELMRQVLFLCPGWEHLRKKAVKFSGELGMALGDESGASGVPAAFDGLPSFDEPGLAGLDAQVAFEQLGGDGLRTGSGVCGFSANGGAIDFVELVRAGFAADGAVLARRLIETVTGAFHVKAGPALVRELADGAMARAWAYGKMIPFLHRDGADDAFVAPCAWAYRLSETKFTLRFGYRLLAVDRHPGGLDANFSRCTAEGGELPAGQALRLN